MNLKKIFFIILIIGNKKLRILERSFFTFVKQSQNWNELAVALFEKERLARRTRQQFNVILTLDNANVVLFRQYLINVILNERIVFDQLGSNRFYHRAFGLNDSAHVFFVIKSFFYLMNFLLMFHISYKYRIIIEANKKIEKFTF